MEIKFCSYDRALKSHLISCNNTLKKLILDLKDAKKCTTDLLFIVLHILRKFNEV